MGQNEKQKWDEKLISQGIITSQIGVGGQYWVKSFQRCLWTRLVAKFLHKLRQPEKKEPFPE